MLCLTVILVGVSCASLFDLFYFGFRCVLVFCGLIVLWNCFGVGLFVVGYDLPVRVCGLRLMVVVFVAL